MPTMAGSRSPEDTLVAPGREVADQLPNARFAILDGQTHQVDPLALAPELATFLAAGIGAR